MAGTTALGVSAITVGGSFNLGSTVAGNNLSLGQALNLAGNTLTHNGASSDTLSGTLTGTNAAGNRIVVSAGTLNITNDNTTT